MPTFTIWDYVWVFAVWLILVKFTVYLNKKHRQYKIRQANAKYSDDSEAAGNEDDVTGGEW